MGRRGLVIPPTSPRNTPGKSSPNPRSTRPGGYDRVPEDLGQVRTERGRELLLTDFFLSSETSSVCYTVRDIIRKNFASVNGQ